MRSIIVVLVMLVGLPAAVAQEASSKGSPHSTGKTVNPNSKGQLQPQGWTGPLETGSGGAPASSPQGQSPPAMQAAPEGSSKSIEDHRK